MTAAPAPALADLLSAKRATLAAVAESEAEVVPPVGYEANEHGEIVPVATAPPPVEYEPQYPTIPPKVVGGLPYVRDYMKLARTIHSTEMVPAAFKGAPDKILACFLRGYEMGFGPMQSLDSFNVIQGSVGLKAEAMRALIMDNGHQFILEDGEGCSTVRCHRKDWPAETWATYTYSLEDARVALLLGKSTWKQTPRAMLDARATSGAARRYFADVLAGMSYTPEEIRDFFNDREEQGPSQPTVLTPSTSQESLDPPAPPTTSTDPPVTAEPAPSVPVEAPPSSPQSVQSESKPRASGKRNTTSASSPTSESEVTAPVPQESAPASESPTSSDVRLEMRKALTSIIASLEPVQQPLCRAFLAQQGYGSLPDLTEAKIQEAINIAAGWPETAVIDAEVVEDLDQVRQELVDDFEQQSF